MGKKQTRTAITDEGRETQIVSLALDEAEKQIRNGTASSQLLTHFVKMGSGRERLEQERLRNENELLKAKVKDMEDRKEIQALYKEALSAMRAYAGQIDSAVDDVLGEIGDFNV